MGLSRLAVRVDGPTARVHDRIRGIEGSFGRSLEILEAARELGLSTQVNTTVGHGTLEDLDPMAELVSGLGVDLWSVFFEVPTERERIADGAAAEAFEESFHRMYELACRSPFDVQSTAAPQYRRVVLQRQVAERRGREGAAPPGLRVPGVAFASGGGNEPGSGEPDGAPATRPRGVNDGLGFLFVSHLGGIHPSGFLPLLVGRFPTDGLVEVYRESPLLRALRNPDRLKGQCGVCEYRTVCGGSRARAYAMTGDPLEADPCCAHVPARWARMQETAVE